MTDPEINQIIVQHLSEGGWRVPEQLNICASLDAMNFVESSLRRSPSRLTIEPGGIGYYLNLLDESCGEPIRASARQRAEAFVKTIGLWKE